MKLHFFGTCAGTEPVPGRKHVSFAVELDNGIYWFDAGENCSYTAHLMGVDLLKIRGIFISHTHMDHVGGLGNLFWNIRKLCGLYKTQPASGEINLYIPNTDTWDGIYKMLKNTEDNFVCNFKINCRQVFDGIVYKNEEISVTAMHNRHLPHAENEDWRSFSYMIEAEGKSIVFSGDVKSITDLEPFLKDGCDILLMETGHHKIADIGGYLAEQKTPVKNLYFIHNGREILQNPAEAYNKAKALFNGNVMICEDASTVVI